MGVNTVDFKESHHYWRPAEIAPKGPARKANCGAKEKAITEFFQSLKFAKVYFSKTENSTLIDPDNGMVIT